MFISKYILDIKIDDIKGLCEKAEKQKNNDLFKYYKKIENEINSNNDIYFNQIIMKKMLDTKLPHHILTFYQSDFSLVVSFIEQLLNDLTDNILLLPNSIKYICKIISILVKSKFKDITKTEENAAPISLFFPFLPTIMHRPSIMPKVLEVKVMVL